MTSVGELTEKLRAAQDEVQYRLYFSALLAAEAAAPADDFFVVGGSAIEFYTSGAYTSGDIDIVSYANEKIRSALRSWGFTREGRVWVSDALRLVVDTVRYPYTGDARRTTVVATPYGQIRLAAIEDLLVKRLMSTRFWSLPGDADQARLLASMYFERIDWAYVEAYARREGVWDLAQTLRAAVERARRGEKP